MSRYRRPNRHLNDCLKALSEPPSRRKITERDAVELVWQHSQCIHAQRGKCPLLIFGRQLAEALNEYFWSDE
jgi:hypothetical protein